MKRKLLTPPCIADPCVCILHTRVGDKVPVQRKHLEVTKKKKDVGDTGRLNV